MATLAMTKKKRSIPAPRDILKAEAATELLPTYTAANLQQGYLLLHEFSRPGGIRYEADGTGSARRSKRVVTDSQSLEKMSTKIVNASYAKYVTLFAHTHWGFFATKDELHKAFKVLEECKMAAQFTNNLAKEQESNRRVRIDVFPMPWTHDDDRFRHRIGEMIAQKLISLREVYTDSDMKTYRVRMDKCRNMERLVVGEQSALIRQAILATEQQRKVMVAMYGDKCPNEWIDPRTDYLRADIQLDFTQIDEAIQHFFPKWQPPPAPARPRVKLGENGKIKRLPPL